MARAWSRAGRNVVENASAASLACRLGGVAAVEPPGERTQGHRPCSADTPAPASTHEDLIVTVSDHGPPPGSHLVLEKLNVEPDILVPRGNEKTPPLGQTEQWRGLWSPLDEMAHVNRLEEVVVV